MAVNCGAIPAPLVESELFGHEKGAFTGAHGARPGHFRAADGGTLFLDEIGELPLELQTRLLRVLQDGEVVPVGGSRSVRVDVRILAATHRNLVADTGAGRFRSDLFYRLAVAVLRLPPLRERAADFTPLVDNLLEQVNREGAIDPGYRSRRLSPAARTALRTHAWPGNVRELLNTLRRAALWADDVVLTANDIRDALFTDPEQGPVVTDRPFEQGFELKSVLAEVAQTYLTRAMNEASSLTEAAISVDDTLGPGSSFRSRQHLRCHRLPAGSQRKRFPLQHEPKRRLLGQCRR